MSRLIKNVSSKIAINVFYKSHIFYFFQHIKFCSLTLWLITNRVCHDNAVGILHLVFNLYRLK